ncbi:MAG: WxcM-like domain-containing protein [Bacteroidetes bacterium]|nr:WxcM-like domain-containing protein [Bacteroidota bacterium]
MRATIHDCVWVTLPELNGTEGNIISLKENTELPFELKRVFYLYDIPGGEARGGHAHKACHQFMIAVSGSFDILLDDGINKSRVHLNDPKVGLHVPPGVWDAEENFSNDAICLVIASHTYLEADYIREYEDYLKYQDAQ